VKAGFIDSIRSRGYWRVNFQPLHPQTDGPLSLQQCENIVQMSGVRLRGWDYPHFPQRAGDDTGIDRLADCVQGWIDWSDNREFWRMYTSSQFLHYRAIGEDWPERSHWRDARASGASENQPQLGVITNLWLISEVTEFLSRLITSAGLYAEGVRFSLELHSGPSGRSLHIDDTGRAPFSYDRTTQAPVITFTKEISAAEAAEPRALAAEAARYIFDRFGWTPSEEQVLAEINKLYELR
jgi:hypothetical protein